MTEVTDERILRTYRRAAARLLREGLTRAEITAGDIKTPKDEDAFLQVSVVVSRGSKRLLKEQPRSGGLLAMAVKDVSVNDWLTSLVKPVKGIRR